MTIDDFFDFEETRKTFLPYVSKDHKGNEIGWQKLRWMRFSHDDLGSVLFKTRMGHEFYRFSVRKGSPRSCTLNQHTLLPRYSSVRPISEQKKKDLENLCNIGVIPRDYHAYFRNLQSNGHVEDFVAVDC